MGISDRLPGETDVVVAGGGVLGICIAYWLSSIYDVRITIVDGSRGPAEHETYRNTGIIHRPFYLDPTKKRVFAQTSLLSHPLWRALARRWSLPWQPIGTLNVAITDAEARTIERYREWGLQNGMEEEELEVVPGDSVAKAEPEVRCLSALLSRNDVSVDFRKFALQVLVLSGRRGVTFVGSHRVVGLVESPSETSAICEGQQGRSSIGCKLLVNAAGGGALGLAVSCGIGGRFAQLNFRGEYWRVDEPFASRVSSNVYRPPRHPQFPFLDPHFVVRADGTRQIGPNAVLVSGPYVYRGIGLGSLRNLLDGPLGPKAGILADGTFLRLVAGEWRSSLSKSAMCARVRKFIPNLSVEKLHGRAVFGVRSSLLDSNGFVPEAVVLSCTHSIHILNYNSPGATGAPSFSAMVVAKIRDEGLADGFAQRARQEADDGWVFEGALGSSQSSL